MRSRWTLGSVVLFAVFLFEEVAFGHWRDSTSASLRQGKSVSLGLGTDGYAAGIYLGKDNLLEASMGTKYDENKSEYEPVRIRTGLTLKIFRGNSFYSLFGAKYDQFRNDASLADQQLEATAYGTFGVGNQWQWDFFTFGVRWLDLYVPIMNQVKVRADADLPASYSRRARGPQQFEPHVEWLGLYAGVAF